MMAAFDAQIWLALLPTWLHPYVFAGKSWAQVSSALITLAGLTSCCFIVHANLCLKLDVPAVFDQKRAREDCPEGLVR